MEIFGILVFLSSFFFLWTTVFINLFLDKTDTTEMWVRILLAMSVAVSIIGIVMVLFAEPAPNECNYRVTPGRCLVKSN